MFDITNYDHLPPCRREQVNKIKIPITRLGHNREGAEQFNEVWNWIKANEDKYECKWNNIKYCKAGGISVDHNNLRLPAYGISTTKTSIELDVLCIEGFYRFIFGVQKIGDDITGRQAFNTYKDICSRYGINIFDYSIDNGAEVKNDIPSPIITLERDVYKDKTMYNVHHLDLNSAYHSGIIDMWPELTKPTQYIYDHRNDTDEFGNKTKFSKMCKAILTHSYGYMQSKWCRDDNGNEYALANLSKQANEYTVNYINDLLKKLRDSGRIPIACNTDGIWYAGDIYHDEREGTKLGQWKNDHLNCTIRFKSKGCYEYIENGKYHPVYRGYSSYEKTKSRDEWEWGDIYKGTTEMWNFDYERGIVYEETLYI